MKRAIGEKIVEYYMSGGIESIPFSFWVFFGIPFLAAIFLVVMYWISKTVSEARENLFRAPKYIANIVFWAVIVGLLTYEFKSQSDYILFAKVLFLVPLGMIIYWGYWLARIAGFSLLEIRKYKISASEEAELQKNPIIKRVIEEAKRVNAAAIIFDTDRVRIYGQGTSLPGRVFTTEPWTQYKRINNGKCYDKSHFIPKLRQDFRITTPSTWALLYSEYGYPEMEYLLQLTKFAEVVKRELQQDYVVLEHSGKLNWDATKEDVAHVGYTLTSSGSVVKKYFSSTEGNRGSVDDFYVSVVRKTISKDVIANNRIRS